MPHNTSLENIVSRETFCKLHEYVLLLQKWNKAINLIANDGDEEIWRRHIEDSYQLVPHLPQDASVMDVGSGGGLPALVLAICCPNMTITMVESDKRKALFLHEVARQLDLRNTAVINERIEAIPPQTPAIITARACASLKDFFSLISSHCNAHTALYLLKGKTIEDEIIVANPWQFEYELYPNTHSDGCIIKITNLQNPSER